MGTRYTPFVIYRETVTARVLASLFSGSLMLNIEPALMSLYGVLPARARAVARDFVSASGIRRAFIDPKRALRMAHEKKRWEVVEPKMERRIALAGMTSLKGKRCMEFGCGMVPTELIYFWKLGASELLAIDYNRIGQFEFLPKVDGFSVDLIGYKAPFDMALQSLHGLDFIHSESVLEHVPPSAVSAVLKNLAASLNPGGVMIHSIDLTDHIDPVRNPYGFLTDHGYDSERDSGGRGNAMRRSDWIAAFNAVDGLSTTFHAEISTIGRQMPVDRPGDLAPYIIVVSRKTHQVL